MLGVAGDTVWCARIRRVKRGHSQERAQPSQQLRAREEQSTPGCNGRAWTIKHGRYLLEGSSLSGAAMDLPETGSRRGGAGRSSGGRPWLPGRSDLAALKELHRVRASGQVRATY